ncbi:ABC transporter substrate-binding protein [Micromonospora echinofusca]|uniref:ABC transporter substrate-binding protein n=1 Tax=Micromonospora echinofusca TaxID=47858 RepID=A0ABS3VVI4_MICEH|nr:ABC transporter substrate-binding protein [Micromonospora echinofusca]MBO4208532.1 ABC transporter substrate-binding protein [Micromonospora echinofusca]
MTAATRARVRRLAGSAAVIALLLAGCSAKSTGADGGTVAGQLHGPGVSADTIRLGILTDLSGPFAPVAKQELAGSQIYWNQRNAAGGVCGRKVVLEVRDHKFSPQDAVSLYTAMREDIAGIQQSIGSPTTAAILDQVEQDSMLTMASSYAGNLLTNPYVVVPGTPYDVETINGVDYLTRARGLAKGAKLGVVYFPGEYGEAVLAGAQKAAEAYGLQLVEQQITPQTTDMTSVLAGLRSAAVHHVVLGTASAQVVSLASLAKSTTYDLTVLVTNILSPGALQTPARQALESNVVLSTNSAPYATPSPDAEKVRAEYEKTHPQEQPTTFVNLGYVMGVIYDRTLTKACENDDLSRAGIANAYRSLGKLEFGGVHVTLDFGKQAEPPSRETYIVKPDGAAKGGTSVLEGPFTSQAARDYQPKY